MLEIFMSSNGGVLALTGTVLAIVSFMLVSRFTSQLIYALQDGGHTRSVLVEQAPGILGDLIVASTFMAGISTTIVGNIMLLIAVLCLIIALRKGRKEISEEDNSKQDFK